MLYVFYKLIAIEYIVVGRLYILLHFIGEDYI